MLVAALLTVCSLFSTSALAVQFCGTVAIIQMLTGPRHGSMILVNNTSCGPSGGYVCLDPDGQYMTPEKSKRLYAFILSQFITKQPIQLTIYEGTFAAACNGTYPVVEDARSP